MKTIFRKSFARDLRKLRDRRTLAAVEEAVRAVVVADRLADVPHVEALADHPN